MLTLLISYTLTDEGDYKLKELLVAPPAHIEMFRKREMKPGENMVFFELSDDKEKMEQIAKMMIDSSEKIIESTKK